MNRRAHQNQAPKHPAGTGHPHDSGNNRHGLGYTTWESGSAGADSAQVLDESAFGVTVVVRNTGSRAGREVVRALCGTTLP